MSNTKTTLPAALRTSAPAPWTPPADATALDKLRRDGKLTADNSPAIFDTILTAGERDLTSALRGTVERLQGIAAALVGENGVYRSAGNTVDADGRVTVTAFKSWAVKARYADADDKSITFGSHVVSWATVGRWLDMLAGDAVGRFATWSDYRAQLVADNGRVPVDQSNYYAENYSAVSRWAVADPKRIDENTGRVAKVGRGESTATIAKRDAADKARAAMRDKLVGDVRGKVAGTITAGALRKLDTAGRAALRLALDVLDALDAESAQHADVAGDAAAAIASMVTA